MNIGPNYSFVFQLSRAELRSESMNGEEESSCTKEGATTGKDRGCPRIHKQSNKKIDKEVSSESEREDSRQPDKSIDPSSPRRRPEARPKVSESQEPSHTELQEEKPK